MSLTAKLFVLAAALGMASLGATRLAHAGAIAGTVVFTGEVDEHRKVPITIDQYICGKEKDAEDIVLGPHRGVRSAVVWLSNPPPGARWENPPAKVEMDQKGCVFVPRVVIVPTGGTVEFLNSDRLLHNLHSTSNTNPSFNRTQPKGRTIPIVFTKADIVRVGCDLHSWMRGWVVVADHPYYAITDDAGAFSIPNVPAGKYTLQLWHETLGTRSREVVVGGQDAKVTIDLKASR